MDTELEKLLKAALEASLYLHPRDPGLSPVELHECAERLGFKPGEVNDAINRIGQGLHWGQKRLLPEFRPFRGVHADFLQDQSPEYRNPEAFENIRMQLREAGREHGTQKAMLPRDVLIERGVAQSLDRQDLDVAISVLVISEVLAEKDGIVRHAPGRESYPLPSEQKKSARSEVLQRPELAQVFPMVKDIIERRSDGRPARANPLDEFENELAKLGHARFRSWWVQKKSELSVADPATQPTTILVLTAALAEAALTFVVPRAHAHGLMRKLESGHIRRWKFVDLIGGCRSGTAGVDPILDERTQKRALDLNDYRQRIHAGYLIDELPNGPIPDLKPEQVREAEQTLDAVLRQILDWLSLHPESATSVSP